MRVVRGECVGESWIERKIERDREREREGGGGVDSRIVRTRTQTTRTHARTHKDTPRCTLGVMTRGRVVERLHVRTLPRLLGNTRCTPQSHFCV